MDLTSVLTRDNKTEEKLPDGFVYLGDHCPKIQQDIKYASTDNFTGSIIDGYFAPHAIITRQAAEQLSLIQDELEKEQLGLLVWDAYRPTKAVRFMFEWKDIAEDTQIKMRFHPDLTKNEIFANGFIALQNSSHSRGSTVDLTIIDQQTGFQLDMGTDFDFFGEESHTASPKVSMDAQENRNKLLRLMHKYGFENLPQEWWHFTLKDEPHKDEYFDFDVK